MGRLAREKLTKATQLRLEAVKESKEATSLQPSSELFGLIFVFNQGTELVFAGFLTLVILQFVLARAPDFLILLLLSHVFSLVLFDEQWTIWHQFEDSL